MIPPPPEIPPAPAGDTVAVYVHVPWCASLCPYCDFDKQAHDFGLMDAYVDAVCRHAALEPRRRAHSLYFGGGTPSLLSTARLSRLVAGITRVLPLTDDAEVTLEANPSDVVPRRVEEWLRSGVNRVSLGVQSLDDAELRQLGRRHTAEKARRAARSLREAGCRNFSLDLMYGLPGQTLGDVARSAEGLLALEPTHVSAYALTLEASTPMGAAHAAGELILPDDDEVAAQYAALQDLFERAGFQQYEVSNWARPGYESRHNLTYWRNQEWIGLGPGAAGSVAGVRYKRDPDVTRYIAAAVRGAPAFVEEEHVSGATRLRDSLMLGLRLSEGVDRVAFAERFGRDLTEVCTARLSELLGAGVLRWEGGRLRIAPRYLFVCNAILAEILPEAA